MDEHEQDQGADTVAFTLRTSRDNIHRLSEIAAGEHRNIAQKLRLMIEQEIAAHNQDQD